MFCFAVSQKQSQIKQYKKVELPITTTDIGA